MYGNDFNLCAESLTSTMPKSEHSYFLVQGITKYHDWRFFTQLMYDKIDTLADNPQEVVMETQAHKACLEQEDDSEVAAIFSNLQTLSDWQMGECKSQNIWNSYCGNDASSSESEKLRCRHTQQSDWCHEAGIVVAMGLGNLPADPVQTEKMVPFGLRLVQNANPLLLAGPKPDPYQSTCRCSRLGWTCGVQSSVMHPGSFSL